MSKMIRPFLLPFLIAGAMLSAHGAAIGQPEPPLPSNSKPRPEYFNASYGPHERNVLDLWQAKRDSPTPVMIFFHGGGFVGGDKWTLDRDLLDRCLAAGISVASANYRYSTQAPAPAPMLDGARAIQFLRYKAKEWNLNPNRIAAIGSSAGAGITLWVAFHDDLADPNSDDPVLRESSRIRCAATIGAQCSYDPRFIRREIGGRAWEHPALTRLYGITPEELDSPGAFDLYNKAAPITYLSAGDPPAYLYYSEPKEPFGPGPNTGPNLFFPDFGKELDGFPKPGQGIHHPRFGVYLKDQMDAMSIECIFRHADDFSGAKEPIKRAHEEMVAFMLRHFDEKM